MSATDDFISRWRARDGGRSGRNYALFLTELCALFGMPPPDPAGHETEVNAYVFERAVTFRQPDGSTATGSISTSVAASCSKPSKADREKARRHPAMPINKRSFLSNGRGEVDVKAEVGTCS